MENLNYTGKFGCSLHMNTVINAICLDPSCKNTLCCSGCIISEHGQAHRNSMMIIPAFVEKLGQHYDMMKQVKSTESPPKDLQELGNKQDETLTALTKQIDSEKDLIKKLIQELQAMFTEQCNQLKDIFQKELERQITTLRSNFVFYKAQYSAFYTKEQTFPTATEVLGTLNKATKKDDLEEKVKGMINELAYGSTLTGNISDKIRISKKRMNNIAQSLRQQVSLKPSILIATQETKKALEEKLTEFKKHLATALKPGFSTGNIRDITHDSWSLSSVILKSDVEQDLIHGWVASDKPIRFTLLYRGSRDGFLASGFHNKVADLKPTLTLVESVQGKVFGGYTDQDWTATENYKSSQNSFLFSVTAKEKYPLNKNQQDQAIYAHSQSLSTFGANHDLSIANKCNENTTSFAALGKTYDAKGKSKEALTGANNFTVKDIEVFRIES
jgi:hypothetical protein